MQQRRMFEDSIPRGASPTHHANAQQINGGEQVMSVGDGELYRLPLNEVGILLSTSEGQELWSGVPASVQVCVCE